MALSTPDASPAIFIDKDGTLIDDIPYNADPQKIRLTPGAVEGLVLLRAAGFRLFLVSNQPGIASGLLTASQVLMAFRQIGHLIAEALHQHPASVLDGFYYCPHSADAHAPGSADQADRSAGCRCRKPAPGMLLRAAYEHGLNLAQSWMIGDILDDIEAGHRAGCRAVLINNGNETEWTPGSMRVPDAMVTRFDEAAVLIRQASCAHHGSV